MDSFWITWFIGIALVIGVRIYCVVIDNISMEEKNIKRNENLIRVLMLICVAIVGGIIVAKWLGMFALELKGSGVGAIVLVILTTLLGALLTYIVGYFILGIYRFDEIKFIILTVVVFILSIVLWSIPIIQYNQNIEYKEETKTQIEERQLIYFSGIPVSQTPGSVSEDSALDSDSVEVEVSTSEEISYWYMNESGKVVQDLAPSSATEIEFYEDESKAYLEIIINTTYTTKINHNNGKQQEPEEDNKSVKYVFHLPKYVTQYSMG